MKKILCLVDFSPTSVDAAHLAAQMARNGGALLTLLHVIHIPIVDTSETALMAGELMAEQKQDAEDKLNAICDQIRSHLPEGDIFTQHLHCLVQEALLTDAVEQMTTSEGYGLVVMGKTGHGNSLEEVLVGSNTQAVIRQVKCPVLAFPEEAPRTAIRKIIYASDYQERDLIGLREVSEVAALLGATIEVVHITDQGGAASSTATAEFALRLQEVFPERNLRVEEYPAEEEERGLQEYMAAREGDMLAILKKEEGFFAHLFRRSLTDRLAYHTRLPLLIVQGRYMSPNSGGR